MIEANKNLFAILALYALVLTACIPDDAKVLDNQSEIEVEEAKVIDYSFDPFSTNLAFEIDKDNGVLYFGASRKINLNEV